MGNRLQIDERPAWTPAKITTIGWYDASDLSTITFGSGSSVAQWDDKSGNDYHLIQPFGNKQPEWGSAEINGLKAIYYSSTFDEMFKAGISDINCTEVCIISILEAKASGDYPAGGAVMKTDETDMLQSRALCNSLVGRTSCTLKLGGINISMVSSNIASLADNNPFILTTWYDGFDGVARANGGEVSTTTNATDGATFTINRIQVGRESNTPLNYHGEMVVLNTSDIDTIERIEGYLAWKWGTVSSLPSNHPYKNTKPLW